MTQSYMGFRKRKECMECALAPKRRRKSENGHEHSTSKVPLAREKGQPTREEVVE